MSEASSNESKSEIRTVKAGTCRSLSGKSTLRYEIGVDPKNAVHLRVVSNSAPGAFARTWVPLDAIRRALSVPKAGEITSAHLGRLFLGGQNTAGFALAALLCEKLVARSTVRRRCYLMADGRVFDAAIQAWLAGSEGEATKTSGRQPKVSSSVGGRDLARTQPVAVVEVRSATKEGSPSVHSTANKKPSPSETASRSKQASTKSAAKSKSVSKRSATTKRK